MRSIIFGIRKSALAKCQLDEFIAFLTIKNLKFDYTIKTIVTQGDQNTTTPLNEMGRGIFTKEIEYSLLRKEIDCAVHSLKDMPVQIEQGTMLSCFPPRKDVRDCLIVKESVTSHNLKGLRIGTGSPRRSAFIKEIESTVETLPLRGNIDTRLRKLDHGDYDAIILAACGLKRLGYDKRIHHYFEPDQFVPAAGQGIICAQTRDDDTELNMALKQCSCVDTELASQAERKILESLAIGCQTPFGVYARFDGEQFILIAKGFVGDKRVFVDEKQSGLKSDTKKVVVNLIQKIKTKMSSDHGE